MKSKESSMKIINSTSLKLRRTGLFYALLLLATTFNSHKTHTMEPIEPKQIGWVALAGATILGGYVAYRQFLSYIHEEQEQPITHATQEPITHATQEPIEPFPFTELPKDVQNTIINLLTINISAQNLREAAQTINALAQVNKELNTLINNPNFCLKIIKVLALKFNCSDEEAAAALKTQEAKNRLFIQKQFLIMCQNKNFDEQEFNILYKTYKGYVDLNFIYVIKRHAQQFPGTLLYLATANRSCPFIKILLNHGADINTTGLFRRTSLMVAALESTADIMQCILDNPNIAINQQDNLENTALLYAIRSKIFDYRKKIKLLLDTGADPEIANWEGLTPLMVAQKRNDQEIIDLIQDAIDRKHEEQGK